MPLTKLKNVDISLIKQTNTENEPISNLTASLERFSSAINTGNDAESFSDEKNNTYFIDETHTKVNFSLTEHPFTARSITVKTELDDSENRITENEVNRDLDQKSTIKSEEENFINNQYSIDQEEVDIKTEDDMEQTETQFKNHKVQLKYKGAVRRHTARHKSVRENHLKLHAVGHNETSQFAIFKCAHCNYESTKKNHLKRHLGVHRGKNMPQIQCPEPECPYTTHDKSLLKSHSLVHNNDKCFKCTQCPYQANRRIHLNEHQLKHESTDKWYACPQCPFRTIRKFTLKKHFRMHANPDQLEWYMCKQCPYKTNKKYALSKHASVHKISRRLRDEIKMHKCLDCPFQSKHKSALKVHSVRHKKPDEIVWYGCTECPYKTIQKGNLKVHAIGHNETGQFEMFKCAHCVYESANKINLKRHLQVHRGKNMPRMLLHNSRQVKTKIPLPRAEQRHIFQMHPMPV